MHKKFKVSLSHKCDMLCVMGECIVIDYVNIACNKSYLLNIFSEWARANRFSILLNTHSLKATMIYLATKQYVAMKLPINGR